MTVIRGDKARALIARNRYAMAHIAPPVPAARTGEFRIDSADGPAVDGACDYVHDLLAGSTAPCRADKAAAVTAELVTNALTAAGAAFLRVRATGAGTVLVEVFDTAPADTALLEATHGPRFARRTGRGLRIVDLVSSRWGVRPGTDGKCVWALPGQGSA